MQVESKMFHISDVLSVTTGLLVSTRGMDGIYDILGFMTQDYGITTIGIAAVGDSCREALLIQYPLLANVEPPDFNITAKELRERSVMMWVADMSAIFGNELEVQSLANPAPGGLIRDVQYYFDVRGR